MTGLSAIPGRYRAVILSRYNAVFLSRYNAVIPSRSNAVIPTVVEGSHNLGSDSDLGLSVREILRLRSG